MSLFLKGNIKYEQLNNCLISLPSSFIYPILDSMNLIVQQVLINLLDLETSIPIVTLGWNGKTTSDSSTVEIDGQYASILGIKDGTSISFELNLQALKHNSVIPASSVEIEPISTADWELTEIYAQAIESNFLSQVRCVTKNQQLLIRVNPTVLDSSSSNNVMFNVKTIKTINSETNFSTLNNNSELHIIPKPHQNQLNNQQSVSDTRKKHSVSSKRTQTKINGIIKRSIINMEGEGMKVYNYSKNMEIFKNVEYVLINVIEGPGTPTRAKNVTSKELAAGLPKHMFGRTVIAKYVDKYFETGVESNEIKENSLGLSPLLAISLGLEDTLGEAIHIEPYNRKSIKLDEKYCDFIIHKFNVGKSDAVSINKNGNLEIKQGKCISKSIEIEVENKKSLETIYHALKELYGVDIPFTDGMKLPIIEKILPYGGIIKIFNENSKRVTKNNQSINTWVLLNSLDESSSKENNRNEINFFFGDDISVPVARLQKQNISLDNVNIYGQKKKLELVINQLLCNNPTFLYGKSGSGKSIICKYLLNEFKKKGYYVRYENFEEAGIAGDSADSDTEDTDENVIEGKSDKSHNKNNDKNKYLISFFEKIARESSWRAPSLVILENLDKVIPKEIEHSDNGTSLQLTELLISIFEKPIRENKIKILITSKSKDSINQIIFQKHFIDEEVCLEAPNKHQIIEILQNMMENKFPEYIDRSDISYLSDIASELEGYLPLDLENLLDRTFHYMIAEGMQTFKYKHFIDAVEGYTPTSLRGVKLQKSTTNWADIGGLIEVKRILLETLEWPTKYAPIFEKCKLRLRSGILLYGYPGCGKTMLASAISSQCGLNFISVKGPEILNKYIGASEQSIRELFERAQSAKPCILFFDEFDSIAPKRGHDSTGVTDRIVNQLLTQMDGAEGLDGVYVLAATSRPDLIDSALLRPGRLDKSVICDLPNMNDRTDILKTIVSSNGFFIKNRKETLAEISKKTEGYTGADLQAVVYNAYLKSVHENLESETNNETTQNTESNEKLTYKTFEEQRKNLNGENEILNNRKRIETLVDSYKSRNAKSKNSMQQDSAKSIKNINSPDIVIALNHLLESLSETKKSISAKELEKLNNIYEAFESSKRPSEMKDGEGSTEVGVRTSLM